MVYSWLTQLISVGYKKAKTGDKKGGVFFQYKITTKIFEIDLKKKPKQALMKVMSKMLKLGIRRSIAMLSLKSTGKRSLKESKF